MKAIFPFFCTFITACFVCAANVSAQTFTVVHRFNNTNGAQPYGKLTLSGETLYGTTIQGGLFSNGSVFSVRTNGTGFTNIHHFTARSGFPYTNSDGATPQSGLALCSNTLYGTTFEGGTSMNGTVFLLGTDGSNFRTLHSFTPTDSAQSTNIDGAKPYADLRIIGGRLYGTTIYGGKSGRGTVFSLNPDGTDFKTLYNFTGTSPDFTNSDGAYPYSSMVLSGSTLYGTAYEGGDSGNGTVFALNTNGADFRVLHSFTLRGTGNINADGSRPRAGMLLWGETLYGTTIEGGGSGAGTVFSIHTNGSGFKNVYSFNWNNGGSLFAGVISSGDTLYGTTYGGGNSGSGTLFAVNTDGTGFTNLHHFTAHTGYTNGEGIYPNSELVLSGNTLYGTATSGGSSAAGTVFRVSLPPPAIRMIPLGESLVLSWPTYAPGVTLQTTTNLNSNWSISSLSPARVNGLNTVTNPISGQQTFFRLSQ